VCPVEAIFADDELPEEWEHYTEWNAYYADQWRDHNITVNKGPLPDAEEWEDKEKSVDDIKTW